MDVNPKPDGPEHQPFIERYELQPIDAQLTGHNSSMACAVTRIVKPDDPGLFTTKSVTGWGPATRDIPDAVVPRGRVAMAVDPGASR
jgi:hypothetical protein